MAQIMRDKFGVTEIGSGYRNARYNASIKGARTHSIFTAKRPTFMNAAPEEVAAFADEQCFGGVGLYKWGIHIRQSLWSCQMGFRGLWEKEG